MDIAVLRQRANALLTTMRSGRLLWTPEPDPVVPYYAERLFVLAHLAVGDADSAAVLVADVLVEQPGDEGAALRTLVALLPQGWLSWPGAAGPAEWLRLGLRREQADRLLSVLGEWDAVARIGLGLWLLFDIRRDDLDGWLGTQGMADRVSEFVGYVGEGLDVVVPAGERPECDRVAADLIDAHEQQVGRLVRLHTLGCDVCRQRVYGLQSMKKLLRLALTTFFRGGLPHDFVRLIVIRRRQMRQPPAYLWKPLLTCAMLLVLYVFVIRKPSVTAAPVAPPQNAAEVLDRALNRWTKKGTNTGVLHERVRLGSATDAPVMERWYDYSGFNRFRITIHSASEQPLFDLASDGVSYVAYHVNGVEGTLHSVLVRGKQVEQLQPLLRQLPVVGSLGDSIVPQDNLDVNLLAEARRGNPTLLGAQSWQGRSSYMLLSKTAQGERLLLTIDQQTLSLLEARIAPNVGVPSTPRRVWTAEVIEVVPRAKLPARIFELPVRDTVAEISNPRRIVSQPMNVTNLSDAAAVSLLPVPQRLPEPSVLAYLRDRSRLRTSVVQVYEGRWSTLLVEAPRLVELSLRNELDQIFVGGRYRTVEHSRPQTSIVEFTLKDIPDRRMRLYLWHALATDDERQKLIMDTLNSMVLLDSEDTEQFDSRFVTSQASNHARVKDQALELLRIRYARNNPRRNFVRLKLEQTMARINGDSLSDENLIP